MITLRQTGIALVLVMATVLFVPWAGSSLSLRSLDDLSVDAAFIIALPAMFLNGTQFGPDAIFTYGPWGFLVSSVVPFRLLSVVFAFRICLVVLPLLYVLRQLMMVPFAWRVILMIGATAIWAFWSTIFDQGLWLLPGLLVATEVLSSERTSRSTRDTLLLAGLSAVSAWAGLVKFNLFVSGAIAFSAILILDLRRRRFPILPLIWMSVGLLAWIAAGQSVANLPLWIGHSLNLSAGYADAMAKGFTVPYGLATLIVFYSGLLLIVSGAGHLAIRRVVAWDAAVLLFMVFLANAFFALQHAISGNQMEQAVGELFGIAFLLALLAARYIPTAGAALIGSLIGLGMICLSASLIDSRFFTLGPQRLPSRLTRDLVALSRMVRGDMAPQRQFWDRLMADTARTAPLPPDLRGSADIYPQHTAVVIADPSLRYTPRPAFLSLNAHTAELAEANAEFLRQRGPDIVLFQILDPGRAVNDRLPATEDGASWPMLLSGYRLDRLAAEFLVLRRRLAPLATTRTLLLDRKIGLGETLELPVRSPLWIEVGIQRSWLGQLVQPFYKPPQIRLSLVSASGPANYQLVPGLAKAGFMVSPLVKTTIDFAGLFRPELVDQDQVSAISIATETGLQWFWKSRIHVRLFALAITPDAHPETVVDDMLRLKQGVGSCLFPPSWQAAPDEPHMVLLVHAPCHSELVIPPGSSGVRIGFGLRYLADPLAPGRTDGAEFRVTAVGPLGSEIAGMKRWLDPVGQPKDRGAQEAVLRWVPDGASDLRIDMDPGPRKDPIFDHTYITSIEFLSPGARLDARP